MSAEMNPSLSQGPLVALVGPTAVGKTDLSIRLAMDIKGEVVSADSRQIYRGMDVGTAKAGAEERRLVPHHLIDVLEPGELLTLAQYQDAAYRVIDDILGRGGIPLLVGGTGLYVRAVLEGLGIPRVPPNPELRSELYARAECEGGEALHRWLAEVDPQAAKAIDARNVRRVIRALEVYLEAGERISELQQAAPPPYRILRIGLTMDRERLYERIDERVERMLAAGLVDEVRGLAARGYDLSLASMSGVGYRQMVYYLQGEVDLVEAVRLIKHATHRFVRQQYNWFRLDDSAINWYDTSDGLDRIYPAVRGLACGFLAEGASETLGH
jgi:tRNA dimethylallyltransferase